MFEDFKSYLKYKKSLEKRLDDTINYYDEHWEQDPNVYEFMTLACDTANMICSRYSIDDYYDLSNGLFPSSIFAKIGCLGNIVKERILRNDLGDSESTLYKLVDEMTEYCRSFHKINNTQKKAFESVGGISLYIKQRERYYKSFMNPEKPCEAPLYVYRNFEEFNNLLVVNNLAQYDNISKGNKDEIMDTRQQAFLEIEKQVNGVLDVDHSYQKALKK